MSVYPGYASTSAQSYGGPVAQPRYQQYYQEAPQPPQPSSDVSTFRQWFSGHLVALVVNNKTMIHNIAFIAREHAQRFGPTVAQCLDHHIRRVHPSAKLPPFYLLDSITKNIGQPYTSLFAAFIASLFLDTYRAVDPSTRNKMEEMLVTWRTGGPGGVELFGAENQATIERSVWGGNSATSSGPTRSQVLTELEVVLAQKVRAVEMNPFDTAASGHVDVLHQLRNLVQNSAVSPAELSAIVTQLRNLARTIASTAPPMAAMPPPPQIAFPPPPMPQQYNQPTPEPQPSSSSAIFPTSALSSLASLLAPSPFSSTAPVQNNLLPAGAPSTAPDVSALFKSLVAAGIVTDPAANKSEPVEMHLAPVVETVVDHKLEAMREYEKSILALPVSLSNNGLQREQRQLVSFMYERSPLQCKQCAQRFSEDEAGSRAMDDHLDLHFRQNRKSTQSTGRGHCRSWFVGIDDWVHDVTVSTDVKGKERAEVSTSAKANAAAAAERITKLREMFVVVPPGEESKMVLCPVCKERMKSEFLEEEEEWVRKNATVIKGKVYHATCHAEAMSAVVASRIRDQTTGVKSRSRSGTPDSNASEGTKLASVLGVKRKLSEERETKVDSGGEGDGVRVKTEVDEDGQPAAKRVALSPPP